jgi:LmbE family N-acetylglucosaminyl deacetylase
MAESLSMMAVLAHPDDESLGFGGALAHYAAEGATVGLITATRGEHGRFGDGTSHPGPEALGHIREAELRCAASKLGVRDVALLGYADGQLDRADPAEAVARIVVQLRRVRPHVVLTFGADGAYGHPDHIAICQLTTAATLAAGDASYVVNGSVDPPHRVAKLYYRVGSRAWWDAYQRAFKRLVSRVDDIERTALPWPEWMITTVVNTEAVWGAVFAAIQCHTSQLAIYGDLAAISEEQHKTLWGRQEYYRVFSLVNGGREHEVDLFAGLRTTESA